MAGSGGKPGNARARLPTARLPAWSSIAGWLWRRKTDEIPWAWRSMVYGARQGSMCVYRWPRVSTVLLAWRRDRAAGALGTCRWTGCSAAKATPHLLMCRSVDEHAEV